MRKTSLKINPEKVKAWQQRSKKPLKGQKRPLAERNKPLRKKDRVRKTGVKSMAKLKKELDAVFSKYVRQINPPICYTCGKTNVTLQCGHFIPRQYLATRWDLTNCRSQCVGCNLFGNGQILDFEENLIRDVGAEKVAMLKASRHQTTILSTDWYKKEIERYKELLLTV